jgi:hypothetical protein
VQWVVCGVCRKIVVLNVFLVWFLYKTCCSDYAFNLVCVQNGCVKFCFCVISVQNCWNFFLQKKFQTPRPSATPLLHSQQGGVKEKISNPPAYGHPPICIRKQGDFSKFSLNSHFLILILILVPCPVIHHSKVNNSPFKGILRLVFDSLRMTETRLRLALRWRRHPVISSLPRDPFVPLPRVSCFVFENFDFEFLWKLE